MATERANSKSCWSIQAGRFGERKMKAPGAFEGRTGGRRGFADGCDARTARGNRYRAARKSLDLGWIKQKGGKTVHAWAFKAEPRQTIRQKATRLTLRPPHSGKMQAFPEIDRAEFSRCPRRKKDQSGAADPFGAAARESRLNEMRLKTSARHVRRRKSFQSERGTNSL